MDTDISHSNLDGHAQMFHTVIRKDTGILQCHEVASVCSHSRSVSLDGYKGLTKSLEGAQEPYIVTIEPQNLTVSGCGSVRDYIHK